MQKLDQKYPAFPTEISNAPFTRSEIFSFAHAAMQAGFFLLADPLRDEVLSGNDTGTVTLRSDMNVNWRLFKFASDNKRLASSEEYEPVDPKSGMPIRQVAQTFVQIDPVDGSGDRKFGIPGSPSAKGYSVLLSCIENGRAVAGICVRPAYRELIICSETNGVELFRIDDSWKGFFATSPVSFQREKSSNGNLLIPADETSTSPETIKINFRPAYSETGKNTNFPQAVLDQASSLSRGRYRFEFSEAGSAGDCFARLLKGELDIVVSGRRADWKSWDTDPFAPAIAKYGGCLRKYTGPSLGNKASALDTWHTAGVISAITAQADVAAIYLQQAIGDFTNKSLTTRNFPYPQRLLKEDGRPLVYDTRT